MELYRSQILNSLYIVTERDILSQSRHLIRDPSEHNVVTVMKRTEGPGNLKTRARRGGGGAEGQVGDTQL